MTAYGRPSNGRLSFVETVQDAACETSSTDLELEGYTVVRYRTAIKWLFTAVSAVHFLHSSEVRSARAGISHKAHDACDVGRNTEEVKWAGTNEFAFKGLVILLQK